MKYEVGSRAASQYFLRAMCVCVCVCVWFSFSFRAPRQLFVSAVNWTVGSRSYGGLLAVTQQRVAYRHVYEAITEMSRFNRNQAAPGGMIGGFIIRDNRAWVKIPRFVTLV